MIFAYAKAKFSNPCPREDISSLFEAKLFIFEPRHEKICLMHMRKQSRISAALSTEQTISAFGLDTEQNRTEQNTNFILNSFQSTRRWNMRKMSTYMGAVLYVWKKT